MNTEEVYECARLMTNGEPKVAAMLIRKDEDPALAALAVGLALSVAESRPVKGYTIVRKALISTAPKKEKK